MLLIVTVTSLFFVKAAAYIMQLSNEQVKNIIYFEVFTRVIFRRQKKHMQKSLTITQQAELIKFLS